MNVWDFMTHKVLQRQYDSDDGKKYVIMICGIDTGSFTTYAYAYVEAMNDAPIPLITCGVKGEGEKVRRFDADTHIYKKSRERSDLYVLEVNQIKDDLAERIQLVWNETSGYSQPARFMNFPTPSDNKYTTATYFQHFEGEHKVEEKTSDGRVTGYKWVKRHSSVKNHYWDVSVYNIALRDIFVDEFMKQAGIKYGGWSEFCRLMKG
jgi:phage terminase large subunit GpA-like protein